jgi:hypothetical protein
VATRDGEEIVRLGQCQIGKKSEFDTIRQEEMLVSWGSRGVYWCFGDDVGGVGIKRRVLVGWR